MSGKKHAPVKEEREAVPRMRVRCGVCGREARPSHRKALRSGWPVCCGYTMTLESTGAFIAAIERADQEEGKRG